MDNATLINELRDWADVEGPGSLGNILTEAADRIEELDERNSIMDEGLMSIEKRFDEILKEIGVRES